MTRYAVRRIPLLPAFRFGSSVGGVIMLLPGLLLALVTRAVVGTLRGWLETWQALSLGPLEADPLDLLKVSGALQTLQTWDERGWLLVLVLTLLTAAVGAILAGLLTILGAAVYNFLAAITGGLALEVQPVGPPVGGMLPADQHGATPAHAPGVPGANAPAPAPGGSAKNATLATESLSLSGNPQQRWPLQTPATSLGSGPDNDIMLPDLALRHAEVRFEDGRYILYDLSNGQTRVNGRLVSGRNLLKDGFKIRVGNHELIFLQR